LFRLFHEDGVRVFENQALSAVCRCSEDRIRGVLASFEAEERADMVEPDGRIHVTCEYCAKTYRLEPESLAGG
ncbi:MAG: Hsp33 family molecular chaperone HslO, partial [Phenylobacterium sp.]|nr:Hsp33 family molecular chaperone HslO [Phenylobacterium sp.]